MQSQDWEELKGTLTAGESEQIEFKETSFLEDTEEIAAQLVSFANRNSGKILIGVKDDGELEGTKIDRDRTLLHILNVAQGKTSPPVEFSSQFLESAEGDVLIVDVKRRKGIPHAVVQHRGGEIKERTYYIRISNGKRLIGDTTLKWLFEHSEEPRLEYPFDIWVQYLRDSLKVPFTLDIAPIYELEQFWLSPFLNTLTNENVIYVLEDEPTRVVGLFIELLPYIVLPSFSWKFAHSWLVTVDRRVGHTSYLPLKRDVDKERIKLGDVPFPPNSSLISQLSFDLKSLLSERMIGIAAPPGTKIKIALGGNQRIRSSELQLIHPNSFNFRFSFEQSVWRVGTAPGHPLGYMVGEVSRSEEQLHLQEKIASVGISSKFTGEFNFPDIEDPLFEDYWHWGNSIVDILKDEWDWGVYVERLPNMKLYSMERDIKEILTILNHQA